MPITWPVWVSDEASCGLRDAEVGEPRLAVAVDEHVVRLDVAVQDAGRMDVAKRAEELLGQRLGLGRLGGAQALAEVAALDVLHDQVGPRAGAEVVDRDEVRVLEARGDPRLAAEALQVDPVARERVGHDLDRDRALQPLVEAEPDHRHAAAADPAAQAVAPAENGVGLDHESVVFRHDHLRFPPEAGL